MDEVVFMLKNGIIGIGRLENDKIKKCIRISFIQKDNMMLVNPQPFFAPLSDEFVDIPLSEVLVYAKVNDKARNVYLQMVSGIAIPNVEQTTRIIRGMFDAGNRGNR